MPNRVDPPSYLAEPTIQYLLQVLEQIDSGEIQFPRFQRFGVWRPEQRRELLRSIREGIPVGTLLMWRTRRDDVAIERQIGAHQLPEARKGEGTRQYVLDGVQRLSTLYGALYAPSPSGRAEDGETADDFRVYYDLREEDFFLKTELPGARPAAHHLPLTALRDSVRLLKFQRDLKSRDAELLTERADALARAFREYKVPVVPLASDDLAHATKTFQRINTQGTPMSEVHMVNALVYSKTFDLLERIREGRQEDLGPVGWRDLDDEAVLRTVKALLGIDVYATQPDETKAALRKRPTVVEEALQALVRVARFLSQEMGLLSPELVPYAAQIVLLAQTLHDEPRPDAKGRAALSDWVALTTFTELFASNMSASRFDALAGELRRATRGEPLQWSVRRPLTRRDLPPIFDFRHARARYLALQMARRRSKFIADKGPCKALADDGVGAVPQLITHGMAGTRGPWMQSPGARIVAPEGTVAKLRTEILSSSVDRPILDSFLISEEVHKLFLEGRFEEGVRAREGVLNARERVRFSALIDRHEPLRSRAIAERGGSQIGETRTVNKGLPKHKAARRGRRG